MDSRGVFIHSMNVQPTGNVLEKLDQQVGRKVKTFLAVFIYLSLEHEGGICSYSTNTVFGNVM
jgi:hypothetical protein